MKDPVPLHGVIFDKVPDSAKDLIRKMLIKSPANRIKAHECLKEPFFSDQEVKESKIGAEKAVVVLEADVFSNLVSYKGISTLKKAALNLLVRQAMIDGERDPLGGPATEEMVVTRQRAEQLRKQFEAIDLDRSGMIRASELAAALRKLDLRLDDADIARIISEIDYYGNGMINYSEFIAAALSIDQHLTEEQLWSLFRKFDVDHTDAITTENLHEAFNRLGRRKIRPEEIAEIMAIHDIDSSGGISFNEFKAIFGNFEAQRLKIKQQAEGVEAVNEPVLNEVPAVIP